MKTDDELLNIYIGDNYDKLKNRNFSWCAFFFGPAYFAYRKQYLAAAILTLIYILTEEIMYFIITNVLEVVSMIKLPIIMTIIFFIYKIIQGIIFKKLYFKETTKKINEIKEKTESELLEDTIKSKGGTNIILAIIVAIITGIITIPKYLAALTIIWLFIAFSNVSY